MRLPATSAEPPLWLRPRLERSRAVEVRVLAFAARAVGADEDRRESECKSLFDCADGARDMGSGRYCPPLLTRAQRRSREPACATTRRSSGCTSARTTSLSHVGLESAHARTDCLDELLTPREQEVIGLMARGFRNREIANALVISESTTKVHVRHVLEKLGVRTRAEAITRFDLFSAQADERSVAEDSTLGRTEPPPSTPPAGG